MTTQFAEPKRDLRDHAERTEPSMNSPGNPSLSPAEHHPHPSRWPGRLVVLVLVAGSFFGGWWLANRKQHEESRIELGSTRQSNQTDPRLKVTIAPITIRPVQRSVEAVGTLHGFEELTLSSEVEGRVIKIHYDLASVVKPEDILLELDPTDAKLAVDQAERALKAELAKWGFQRVPSENEELIKLPIVESARLRFELAKSRLQRMLPLKSTNSIAAEDLEQAESDERVMESDWKNQLLMANSAAATARLKAAELEIAKQRLNDCLIRVPIPTLVDKSTDQTYTVSERLVSEGTLLRPGTEVFRLVLGKTLKLRLSVPEFYSSKVEVGQTVEVKTNSVQGQQILGKVARVSPAIDRATRSFLVEVEVPNENALLKPGSFAKAKILVGNNETATTVPLSALYSFAGINKVFTIENGLAKEFKVQLGEQTSEWVEISSPPLSATATVVTSGQRMLSEGLAVSIRDTSDTSSIANAKEGDSNKEQR